MLFSFLFIHSVFSTCATLRQNVEWREMTSSEQDAFIKAILCLRSKPSVFGAKPGSLWDDLTYAHANVADQIHNTAVFLPWHRHFLQILDSKLINSCGYKGRFPYWDEAHDSQAPELSPIWTKFGSNGAKGTHCVFNGELANIVSNYPSKHCVKRNWSPAGQDQNGIPILGSMYSPAQVAYILASKDYDSFRQNLENILHNNVHVGVGGDMYDPTTSPGDPIFYMHHRNVDRLWWIWQKQNPKLANTFFSSDPNDKPSMVMPSFSGLEKVDYKVSDVLAVSGGGAGGTQCVQYSNSITPSNNAAAAPGKRSIKRGYYTSTITSVHPFDRNDNDHIRYHEPIPDDYLHIWHYKDDDIKKIRDFEKEIKSYTEYLNSLPVEHFGTLHHLKKGLKYGYRSKTEEEHDKEYKILIDRALQYKAAYHP
ncbi:hypothetical protein HDV06_001089 [Boothiomyces sp. JEL0866]|nr:hypothetical protein HDV06_001089 [Boothiomyces sp. JEL0866]